MLDVTLDELTHILGEPTRQSGHQYYFRCPACSAGGGDTSADNLLFNERKGLLKCFACDDGAKETLRLLNEKRRDMPSTDYIKPNVAPKVYTPWWELNKENLALYMCEAESEMNDRVADWLWRKHGIDQETISNCCIGYDKNPTMINIGSSVTFPMVSLNHNWQIVGFELRQIGLDKIIRHTPDAPSCLCIIADSSTAKHLVIVEGFKDGYCLRQLMRDKGILNNYTILTPAHGVGDIVKNISGINLTRYTTYSLILDNDNAGDKEVAKIIEKYPFFKDRRDVINGYDDIAEMWIKDVRVVNCQ